MMESKIINFSIDISDPERVAFLISIYNLLFLQEILSEFIFPSTIKSLYF